MARLQVNCNVGFFVTSSTGHLGLIKDCALPSIVKNNAVQGETFLPGQIFIFGGFALRANSLGHLEQIESYAPGHQSDLEA